MSCMRVLMDHVHVLRDRPDDRKSTTIRCNAAIMRAFETLLEFSRMRMTLCSGITLRADIIQFMDVLNNTHWTQLSVFTTYRSRIRDDRYAR